MVILSAAIKGVPRDLVEAARIDGGSELQIFFRVIVPTIRGSILTVFTTIAIAVLKVFDIIFVTTGGNFDTSVVAVRMYQEMFRFRNFGQATTMAVILLVAVLPIMIVNIRNLRRQGVGA
jgi:alpha-glucoside transport system permease protein